MRREGDNSCNAVNRDVVMRLKIWVVILLICLSPASWAGDRDRDLECEKIKQDIREVQARMRAGYTRAQGEKLRAKLRKLRALRAKACR